MSHVIKGKRKKKKLIAFSSVKSTLMTSIDLKGKVQTESNTAGLQTSCN